MRTITIGIAVALLAAALAACGDEENETVRKVDETIREAHEKAVGQYRTALDDLDGRIRELEAKYEAAEPEKREELADAYGAVIEAKAKAETRLKALAAADGDEWEDAREEYDSAWTELEEQVEELAGSL